MYAQLTMYPVAARIMSMLPPPPTMLFGFQFALGLAICAGAIANVLMFAIQENYILCCGTIENCYNCTETIVPFFYVTDVLLLIVQAGASLALERSESRESSWLARYGATAAVFGLYALRMFFTFHIFYPLLASSAGWVKQTVTATVITLPFVFHILLLLYRWVRELSVVIQAPGTLA